MNLSINITISDAIQISYLIAAIAFMLGIKYLSSPATARKGNLFASSGMLLAIITTLFNEKIISYELIIIGVIAGSLIGVVLAKKVQMTAMPQLVAIFNGFGGAASALIASAEFINLNNTPDRFSILMISLSVLIGFVTFSGSIIAFLKLQELISGRAIVYPLQKTITAICFVIIITLSLYLIFSTTSPVVFIGLLSLCLILGILLVIPIGGADMPVVVSLLNSYSGLAAAVTGFLLNNLLLVIAGSLVGAAGLILTTIMTKAMNRSLMNVIFGNFGAVDNSTSGSDNSDKIVRSTSFEEVAILLAYADRVIFVPGYGLAVAQAQHQVRELADLLESKGVDIRYAIHPVAGRMPGHMNVLLAEANIAYDKLYDLESINDSFSNTDVSVVIGANDVINPAARDTPSSPLFGMPILNVDKSRNVVVLKRSMSPGFAGVDNDLFYMENTMMFFRDAKDGLNEIITEVKDNLL
jgi:NAD(P) transhydrogenase subunit beta